MLIEVGQRVFMVAASPMVVWACMFLDFIFDLLTGDSESLTHLFSCVLSVIWFLACLNSILRARKSKLVRGLKICVMQIASGNTFNVCVYSIMYLRGPQTLLGNGLNKWWATERSFICACTGFRVVHVKPYPQSMGDNCSSETSLWSQKGWGHI